MHSNVTIKNVSWPQFSWPTLYVCSVEAGMGMERQIMCIKQCTLVEYSTSRSSKCTKIVGGWRFIPDPTGELTTLPRPVTEFTRSYTLRPLLLRGNEGKKEKMLCQNDSGRQKPSRRHCFQYIKIDQETRKS